MTTDATITILIPFHTTKHNVSVSTTYVTAVLQCSHGLWVTLSKGISSLKFKLWFSATIFNVEVIHYHSHSENGGSRLTTHKITW
jgi:hypothetical protein